MSGAVRLGKRIRITAQTRFSLSTRRNLKPPQHKQNKKQQRPLPFVGLDQELHHGASEF
jgi:hypothetical protein